MSKNFDQIATVEIDLTSPVIDESSFGNLLIVGPLPKVVTNENPPMISAYSSIDEVIAAGWVVSGDNADPVGAAARVAFGQSPKPTRIYIAPIQMVQDESAEEGAAPAAESVVATIQRAVATDGWYVVCTAGVDSSEYKSIAAFVETQEKMFCYTEMNIDSPAVADTYYRTLWIFGRESADQAEENVPELNKYMNVAWVAKWLQYEAGSETAAFKVLNMVSPAALTTAEMDAITKAHGSYFTTVGNKNIVLNGTVAAGEWADIIRFRDWQKNDMQAAVVNLFISRPKVPYTDSGIALVQNQMAASLKRGQDRGGIAEEEFDEDGNTIPAFTTSVPMSSSIPAAEKATRQLRNCKFKARLAGAIHFAELKGSLTYEM